MIQKEKLVQIKKIMETEGVKLTYLFGSQATGKIGPLSDFDFAILLGTNDPKTVFEKKARIQIAISQVLGTDAVDIVILDTAKSLELKYQIIKNGKILFEKEPYKIVLEPLILNEYFDFYSSLKKFGLTQA